MRDILSSVGGFPSPFGQRRDIYATLGLRPALVFDFTAEYYRTGGNVTTFGSAVTFARASNATYVDSAGVLQTAASGVPRLNHHVWNGSAWVNKGLLVESEARTNLLLNSAALSTQNVTVTAVPHTLHFTGTGTVTLSGAATGSLVGVGSGEQNRQYLTFTPAAGTLTLTITGTVTNAQLEAGSTPSSYIPTAGATATRAAETLTVPAANLPWPSPVVIGEELVTNGTFDTDTSGWSALNNGSASVSGQEAVVSAPNNYGGIQQTISVTAGSLYQVTVDMYADAGGGADIRIDSVFGLNTTSTTPTTQTAMFVATYTGLMTLKVYAITANINAYFDNISVKEINPLAVSIQMKGEMTYADAGINGAAQFFRWYLDANNYIFSRLDTTATQTGKPLWLQSANAVLDTVAGSDTAYTPGINVPFNIASRHGSTFINGAVDGTALTADTTPVALPDLSATNLSLGYTFMGTISEFRMWADDLGNTGIAEASA